MVWYSGYKWFQENERKGEKDSSDCWVVSDVVEMEWRKWLLVFKVYTTIVRVGKEKTVGGT